MAQLWDVITSETQLLAITRSLKFEEARHCPCSGPSTTRRYQAQQTMWSFTITLAVATFIPCKKREEAEKRDCFITAF